MRLPKTLIALLLLLSLLGCRDANKAKSFEQMVDRIADHYVEDRRTDRFEVEHVSGFRGLHLRGYTTIPAAYDSLMNALATGFVVAQNDFRLLPDAGLLEGKTAGIIKVSVANLRSTPGHSQELATQALLGTPIQVLDFQNGWYLVRTPDRYLAWLEPGAFVRLTPPAAARWFDDQLRTYAGPAGVLAATADGGGIVSDLVYGNLLKLAEGSEWGADKMVRVQLPDGEFGFVKGGFLTLPDMNADRLNAESLLEAARKNSGRPYLWGGTSPKAMDCSGFTKTAYFENGFVIPRDASQQVHAGESVKLTADFANLLPGDLLFFGRYRQDGSEKITHVGIYTGMGRFVHAGADNGRIMEQSLVIGAEDFAEHRLKSLLRVRRLSAGSDGVVPLGEAFSRLLEPVR